MSPADSVRAVGRRTWQWLRALPPLPILAVGWVGLVLYAFPGLMTMDSFDQLREGREWFFTDSHPPVMAALWGVIDWFIPGPPGMLVLQASAFLAGLYLILRRAITPRRAAVCSIAILLFPPVFAPLAVIWKDCLMAGFLVLGIAAVLDDRRWVRILALALFSLATAMRYNALAATLPPIVLLFEWKRGMRWLARYAIAAGAWLVVVIVALGANALLVDRELHYWYSSSALADITGTLAKVEPDIPDAELAPLLAPTEIRVDTNLHAAVRAKYKPYDFQQLIDPDGLWAVPWTEPMPPARRDAIGHAWNTIVLGHPGAYARYRLEMFAEIIGLSRKYRGGGVVQHRGQYKGMLDHMGVGSASSALQENWEQVTVTARRTRLFRPHVYLFLSLALLAFCRRHRDILAVVLSGVFMELTLLVLGWTPDYRFSHWLVVCTCIATVMLIARRAKAAT